MSKRSIFSAVLIYSSLPFALGACKKDDAVSTTAAQGTTTAGAVSGSASASAAPAASDSTVIVGRAVAIDVGEHGFTPNEVTIQKGDPTTLVFTRSSNSTCAFEVVFPDLGITKELPLHRPVAIVVPVDTTRTLGFQCGMGMYKSKVVVM